MNYPPSLPGLPFVGNLLEFQKDRFGMLRRGFETLGPIFTIHLGPKPVVVLVGPEYHDFVFRETDKKLSMDKAYVFLRAMFEGVAFTAGPAEYDAQRPVILAPFAGKKMPGYVEIMVEEINAWIAGLGDAGEFEVVSSFQGITQLVAAHALMGKAFRDQMGKEFWDAYADLSGGIDVVLPPHLPLPKFIKRDRAKARLAAMIQAVIDERRAHPEEHHDFMQDFVEAKYKDGRPLPDELIVNMILALIFAGHETTAGQGSWALILLLQHPEYLNKVTAELSEHFPPGAAWNHQVMRQLPHLDWALRETERLRPSADIIMRYNLEGYSLGGYDIPADWMTMLVPRVAHLNPAIFTHVDDYDPLRFSPERAEDKVADYTLIGFGGGRHRCAGANFAHNEMATFLALCIQQLDMRLLDLNPGMNYGLGAPRPTPTRIAYRRRDATADVTPQTAPDVTAVTEPSAT